MYIYLGLFVVFTLILFYRVKRKTLLQHEFKYKLGALKDELRWACINGHIDSDSWAYNYLDHTITIAMKNLRYFNIYSAIGLNLVHSKDNNYKVFTSSLYAELQKPENKNLNKIYEKFGEIVLYYVAKKHIFFRFLVHGYIMYDRSKRQNKPPTATEKKIYGLRDYPETSASREFTLSASRIPHTNTWPVSQ